MSRVDAVAATERLPWLSDEPPARSTRPRRSGVTGWAAAAVLVVAAGSYWAGVTSAGDAPAPSARQAQPATIVRLPEPRPAAPRDVRIPAQPRVRLATAPEVHPAPAPEVSLAPPPARQLAKRTAPAQSAAGKTPSEAAKASIPGPMVATAAPRPAAAKRSPPRIKAGAAGRLVQVGAFGSPRQARRGWRFMVRACPAAARLPTVVTETHNSKGRAFYRFQVGTTSQAHSEVLCQRMQKIGLSCAVVGLPRKGRVEP